MDQENPQLREALLSLVNPVHDETTYLLTRRCVQRQFWLLPTPTLEQIFGYVLGLAAERHGVALHEVVVLSNHWHAVFTDPAGRASEFARDVHALVARCLNAHLGRWESIWSSDGLSLVRLIRPEEVFAEMLYTEVNAVAAGLVSSPDKWEGLRASPRHALRKPRKYRRPEKFFRKGDVATCPEEVELVVTVPPCFEAEGTEAFIKRFEEAVKGRVEELHAESAAQGLSYLGMRKVREQRRKDSPDTREPRRGRKPTVACRDPELRRQVLAELVQFRRDYRAARTAWLAGQSQVHFPRGTYLMRAYPNVVLARPPDTARAAA